MSTQSDIITLEENPEVDSSVFQPPLLTTTPPISSYSTQDSLLYKKLTQFYKMSEDETENPNLDIMIQHKARVSLRLLDWCVTNYAKQRYISYNVTDAKGRVSRFNMHNSYQLNLDSYSKFRFDPFCRWNRIQFPYKNGMCIETTIAQLSFYKWAIENKVLDYIDENYESIERDMIARNSNSRRSRTNASTNVVTNAQPTGGKTRKRREELSVSASKFIKKEDATVVISFS